jgi:hypothetical protein
MVVSERMELLLEQRRRGRQLAQHGGDAPCAVAVAVWIDDAGLPAERERAR